MESGEEELEWEIEEARGLGETSYDLLVCPFVINGVITFTTFEYPDHRAREVNYSRELGTRQMDEDDFEDYKNSLRQS